jgi:hypothetical protein
MYIRGAISERILQKISNSNKDINEESGYSFAFGDRGVLLIIVAEDCGSLCSYVNSFFYPRGKYKAYYAFQKEESSQQWVPSKS